MVSEGALNPIPILVHLVAIAAGLFVGWTVMDRITPDFPSDDSRASSRRRRRVRSPATIPTRCSCRTTSRRRSSSSRSSSPRARASSPCISSPVRSRSRAVTSTAPTSSPTCPWRRRRELPIEINEQRPELDLAQIAYMDLIATRKGPRWYVQIDIGHQPAAAVDLRRPARGQPADGGRRAADADRLRRHAGGRL